MQCLFTNDTVYHGLEEREFKLGLEDLSHLESQNHGFHRSKGKLDKDKVGEVSMHVQGRGMQWGGTDRNVLFRYSKLSWVRKA